MRFRSKTIEIEANQFFHGATAPIGVRTREDGSCYVVTIHGKETDIDPGDWIILENPPGDGTLAYPCKPEMFEKRYELMTAQARPTIEELEAILNDPNRPQVVVNPDGSCSAQAI